MFISHEEGTPSTKDLSHLSITFLLAQKMGEELGECQVLQ